MVKGQLLWVVPLLWELAVFVLVRVCRNMSISGYSSAHGTIFSLWFSSSFKLFEFKIMGPFPSEMGLVQLFTHNS